MTTRTYGPATRTARSLPRLGRPPLLADARRQRRLALLGCWALAWFIVFAYHGGYSWHYFTQGGSLLFDGAAPGAPAGGLHLYANYPQLQIGPFTFAVSEVLRQIGPSGGVFVAEVVMTVLGLVVIDSVERIAVTVRPDLAGRRVLSRTMLVAGAAFLIGWVDLAAGFAHLDDVLALVFAVLAVRALVSDLPAVAGVCLGLAIDAKPWALLFLPLILAAPRGGRRYVAFFTALVVLVAWLPFVLADPHTLGAAGYTITNAPSSALRALGVSTPGTPHWDRAAQLILGCLLGALAILRHRWPAVILLGVGARIVLDPAVYGYYSAGVLLGALLWDVLGMRWPVPLWTVIAALDLCLAPHLTANAGLLGDLRLWLVLGFTATLLLAPANRYTGLGRRLGLERPQASGTRRGLERL